MALQQNAVLESRQRVAVESPQKVLNGNQVVPSTDLRYSQIWRRINGFYSLFWGRFGPAGLLNATAEKQWSIYTTRTDHWSSANTYDGSCYLSGPGFCPQSQGYPNVFTFDPDVGSTALFTQPNLIYLGPETRPPPTPDSYGLTQGILSETSWTFHTQPFGYEYSFTATLGNARDLAGDFDQAQRDLLARSWPADWNSPNWGYQYNLGPFVTDCSGLNPASFDGSLVNWGGGNGGFIIPRVAECACSGWDLGRDGNIKAYRGQLRYRGAQTQAYWIGRYRSMGDFPGDSGTWNYSIDLVGIGLLIPQNGVAVLEVPFTPGIPFPLQKVGSSPVLRDFYFAALGGAAPGTLGSQNWP